MDTLIKAVEYKTHTIEVHIDTEPFDPREWDNLGTIVTAKFWLEVDHLKSAGWKAQAILDHVQVVEKNGGVVLPIYVYSHGMNVFRTKPWRDGELPQGHARFDSGLCGFIYCKAETIRDNYRKQRISRKLRERVTKVLEAEIKTVNDFSTGNVYGYKLIDQDGETIDSCWGYYGDYDYMVNEVLEQVDRIMQKPHTREPVIAMLGA